MLQLQRQPSWQQSLGFKTADSVNQNKKSPANLHIAAGMLTKLGWASATPKRGSSYAKVTLGPEMSIETIVRE